MRPDVCLKIAAGAFEHMTVEQFHALKGIAAEGNWDHVTEDVFVSGTDYLGVHLPHIFIGIEKDGYTHS